MEAASPAHPVNRVLAVQHLVEDDPIEEVARDQLLVEHGMHADQSILHQVGSDLDGVLRLAPAGAAPGDVEIELAVEVEAVKPVIHRA